MAKYNHAFTIAFSLESDHPTGDDVTGEMLAKALQKKIEELDSDGDIAWMEACDAPFDTYEVEDG